MAAKPRCSQAALSRRHFLQAGTVGTFSLTMARWRAADALATHTAAGPDTNCILLLLVGGPSHLDTWDPKPNAPADIRGPFRTIPTRVPGMHVSELFPKMAGQADKFSLVRSVHHSAASVHDAGHQLMQTGRLFRGGRQHPHAGCVLGYLTGRRAGPPSHVVLPTPIGRTGGNMPHGQSAAFLGPEYEPCLVRFDRNGRPVVAATRWAATRGQPCRSGDRGVEQASGGRPLPAAGPGVSGWTEQADSSQAPALGPARRALALDEEPPRLRDQYGRTRFGQSCLLARRLVEHGVRFVTVNMYETVFGTATWDTHGCRPFTTLGELASRVAPSFDAAFSALLEDLSQRGLLSTTMVVAMGEFGRSPKINAAGGRDHHTGAWTIIMAGGPVQGGRSVGRSDTYGYEPADRPVTPAEVVATIYCGLGLRLNRSVPGPAGRPVPVTPPGVQPLRELF